MADSSRRSQKTAKRRTAPEPSEATGRPAQKRSVTSAGSPTAQEQSDLFGQAIALFHARDFGRAGSLFEKAAVGPSVDIAHSARVYRRVCEQRLASAPPVLKMAEEYYDYAIRLLNERKPDAAEPYLIEAARLSPEQDHIHYSLALCHGMQGEIQDAYAHLRRAVELDPRNRSQARNDPDFAEFARHPLFDDLLRPKKGNLN